ncbi:hypothetical protein F5141DRAFT_1062720 [Pisolithus sp. B1]|nr:hypothetical protein F5141DRAFT_1062720 [Pisolithus sp. B1]
MCLYNYNCRKKTHPTIPIAIQNILEGHISHILPLAVQVYIPLFTQSLQGLLLFWHHSFSFVCSVALHHVVFHGYVVHRLLVMSESSQSQDVPFCPLHELFAEMNVNDATSSTVTWTHRTTEESLTISHTPPSTEPTPGIWSASHSPTTNLTPTEHVASITTACPQKLKGAVKSSTKPALSYIPPIPHPTHILLPKSNVAVQGYYVITVGQEVGIFYTW